MKKSAVFVISILALLFTIFTGTFIWYQGSVYTAYYNFSKSIKDKNSSEFSKYIDYKKTGEYYLNLFDGLNTANDDDKTEMEKSFRESIEKSVKEGTFVKDEKNLANSQIDAFTNKKLTQDGNGYKVTLYSNEEGNTTKFDLTFTKEGRDWKITKIFIDLASSFSNASSKPSEEIKELKLNEEVSGSKFKIKVTKVEFLPILEMDTPYSYSSTKEKITIKPQNPGNQFAKVFYEVTNISKEGNYFADVPGIVTEDGKTYKPEYIDNMFYFEKIEDASKKNLIDNAMVNPDNTGYGLKIIEVPTSGGDKQKVVFEDKNNYPKIFIYKWMVK